MRCAKFVVLLLFFLCGRALCQQIELSPAAQVSILTVGTADELYAKFGHSAIRVHDPSLGLDVVYNYGLFDFSDPNFYTKFTRGKLDYRLGRQQFDAFLYGYELENRWVKEQVLDLSLAERESLLQFLENNHLPENRYYKYDFLFDNCSTRVPDALKKVLGPNLKFNYQHLSDHFTFRQLIHQNLELNSWSNFGIDLALGAVIDKKATPWQHLFLPIYVFKQLPHTTIDGHPLVSSERSLFEERPVERASNLLATPIFWLSLLLLLVIVITYLDHKKNTRARWLDFMLFLVTGAAGLLILFLWWGTDHTATANNFNALWAFAPNLLVAFFLLRKNRLPTWFKYYLITVLGLLVLTLMLWVFAVQSFSPLIVFVLLTLALRYGYLLKGDIYGDAIANQEKEVP